MWLKLICGERWAAELFFPAFMDREEEDEVGNMALEPRRKFWAAHYWSWRCQEAEVSWSQELLATTPRLHAQSCSLIPPKLNKTWQKASKSSKNTIVGHGYNATDDGNINNTVYSQCIRLQATHVQYICSNTSHMESAINIFIESTRDGGPKPLSSSQV